MLIASNGWEEQDEYLLKSNGSDVQTLRNYQEEMTLLKKPYQCSLADNYKHKRKITIMVSDTLT